MTPLIHPMGSMGEEVPESDEADRAEVERINMDGARYRERVRLVPLGSEPWDLSGGDAA